MNIPPPNPGPSPHAPLPAPEKRLRRKTHSSVAGVASGLADYLGISTKWVRIGLIVGLIFGGASFFLYGAAWIAVPTEIRPRPPAPSSDE